MSQHQFRNTALAGVAAYGAYKIWQHVKGNKPFSSTTPTYNGGRPGTPDQITKHHLEGYFEATDKKCKIQWIRCDMYQLDNCLIGWVELVVTGRHGGQSRVNTPTLLVQEKGRWIQASSEDAEELYNQLVADQQIESHYRVDIERREQDLVIDQLHRDVTEEVIENSEHQKKLVNEAIEKLQQAAVKMGRLEEEIKELKEERDEMRDEHTNKLAVERDHSNRLEAKAAARLSKQYEPIQQFLRERNSDSHVLLEIDEELVDFFGGQELNNRVLNGSVVRGGDIGAVLTNAEYNDVVYVTNIHLLEDFMQPVLAEQKLDLVIGDGPDARTIRIDLCKFTVVGIIPKGEKTTLTGMDHYRLKDGKVVSVSS